VSNPVEEIKQKVDIVDIISKSITLKKRGRHHVACCPFHSEKTPSFTVSPELQIFKCFGCGKSGDVFTFLQEYHHISFSQALQDLAKITGVKLEQSPAFTKEELIRKKILEINQEVAKFYHHLLTQHPLGAPALDYLKNRGIKPETIKLFKIGYSPKNSDLILKYLSQKNFSTNDLIATGTFGKSQYGNRIYDRFSDRLTFPLVNYRDQIVGFSGRILPSSANQNLAKYINSPATPAYFKSQMLFGLNLTKDNIRTQNSAIITEGEFDMITPYQAGITNIVALKGTAFTKEQLTLLRRYTDTLILALDSDLAGSIAAQKSIQTADSFDFDIRILIFDEKYKDPDEVATKDIAHFQDSLKNTVPVWDYLINSSIKNFGIDSPKAKKQVLQNVLPFLTKINNSVIRSDYLSLLATQIGSDPQSILEESQKYLSVQSPKEAGESTSPAPIQSSQVEKLQEYLLSLVLTAKKPVLLAKKLKKYLNTFQKPTLKTIIDQLLKAKKYSPATFQSRLPAEVQPTFQSLYLSASNPQILSEVRSREIKKTIASLETINLKDQINKMTQQIAQLEQTGQLDELKSLEMEYNQLLVKHSRIQSSKD
jgi:DNA primase